MQILNFVSYLISDTLKFYDIKRSVKCKATILTFEVMKEQFNGKTDFQLLTSGVTQECLRNCLGSSFDVLL